MYDWRSNKLLFQISITILIPLDISAIILNGLIAYVLKRHKKTSIITFWFIYCLSVSDVMVGLMHFVHHILLVKLFQHPGRTFLNSLNAVIWRLSQYFLSTSGRLIFIIAVDRCIHMKYLTKYTTIVTHFRARLILFLNVIFGLVLLIPSLLLQEEHVCHLHFGIHIFHTVGTIIIYIIYIKTYFCIKEQVAALQTINSDDIAAKNMPGNTNQCHNGSPTAQRGRRCVRINTTKEIFDYNTVLFSKDNMNHGSQQEANVVPDTDALRLNNLASMFEETDSIESNAQCSNIAENVMVPHVEKVKIENEQPLEDKQQNKVQKLEDVIRMKQRKQVRPDREFRKTTLLILLALFICYAPFFIQNIYSFAGGQSVVFSTICRITLLLNSSLNAVILIAYNREMKRNIKAIFEQCWASNFPQQRSNTAT